MIRHLLGLFLNALHNHRNVVFTIHTADGRFITRRGA